MTRGAVDAFLFAADEHVGRWRRAGFVGPRQRTYQVMEASTALTPIPRADAEARTGVRGRPAILWVGRLNANKDPLTVLEAFERALATLPEATLTMLYGSSELGDDVRARVACSAALRDRVRLAGAVAHDQIGGYFSAADLFVAGSHHEGSGYALIEALACGATPVVTDIPSFRVLTRGGAIGILWPVGDVGACARALAIAGQLNPDAERARIREHFARHASWAAVGRRAMEIYTDVVTARRAGAARLSAKA
jgi:glycosyltransferase involved in cell wall biosynthesis